MSNASAGGETGVSPYRPPGLLTAQQYVLFTKIYVALWFSTSLFGTWSNSINLRTYFKMDREESVTILFIALSLSDLSVCLVGWAEAVSTVVEIVGWTLPRPLYINPVIVNTYLSLFRRMFSVMTVLTTMFLALQRCLCVVLPFTVRDVFTPVRTYVFMVAPCLVSATAFLAYAGLYRTAEVTDPRYNVTVLVLLWDAGRAEFKAVMSVATGIVLNVTAQVVILVCLVVMGNGLRKAMLFKKSAMAGQEEGQKTDASNSKDDKHRSKETQALVQVTLVAAIFVVINTPFLVVAIVCFFIPEIDLYNRYSYLYIVLYRVVFLCELINSSVNFFVYYNYNSRFRSLCFSKSRKSAGKEAGGR